jgi:hypothetical protein
MITSEALQENRRISVQKGMRAEKVRVEADPRNPARDEPSILPGRHVLSASIFARNSATLTRSLRTNSLFMPDIATVRIFVSSPGDVRPERLRAEQVNTPAR